MQNKPISVLVVDDSALMRKIITSILNETGRLMMNDDEKIKFGKMCGYPVQESLQISNLS